MNKFYLALATAAMLFFSMGAFASAQQAAQQPNEQSGAGQGQGSGEGHGQHVMTPETMLEHLTKELSLTDDQQAKIKPILEEHMKQANEARQDTSASREDRRAKMKQIHEDMVSQIRPILNPDQQKKADEMMSRHAGNGGQQEHPDHDSGSNPQPH
jgi:periplasmic protein CpxP/Spy